MNWWPYHLGDKNIDRLLKALEEKHERSPLMFVNTTTQQLLIEQKHVPHTGRLCHRLSSLRKASAGSWDIKPSLRTAAITVTWCSTTLHQQPINTYYEFIRNYFSNYRGQIPNVISVTNDCVTVEKKTTQISTIPPPVKFPPPGQSRPRTFPPPAQSRLLHVPAPSDVSMNNSCVLAAVDTWESPWDESEAIRLHVRISSSINTPVWESNPRPSLVNITSIASSAVLLATVRWQCSNTLVLT